MQRQLIFDLHNRYQARFADFLGEQADYLCAQVRRVVCGEERFAYLYGGAGSGKTHLLESACYEAMKHGKRAMYIDLRHQHQYTPDMLAGLEGMELVCLDNLDAIAGYRAWEEGLFHLFNRLQAASIPLLVTASTVPLQLALCLPDLQTRLSLGILCQVEALSDDARAQIVLQRAACMGLCLPAPCLHYIMRHYERSIHRILQLLDQIAERAFAQKKAITLPLVKAAMKKS
jgi:DnaA family protein